MCAIRNRLGRCDSTLQYRRKVMKSGASQSNCTTDVVVNTPKQLAEKSLHRLKSLFIVQGMLNQVLLSSFLTLRALLGARPLLRCAR